ncbi:MAG: hypothetical protein JWN86_4207 [Planctomycetota bacterium]|nr:hypothetical protein [Planctomycetota bacterium]
MIGQIARTRTQLRWSVIAVVFAVSGSAQGQTSRRGVFENVDVPPTSDPVRRKAAADDAEQIRQAVREIEVLEARIALKRAEIVETEARMKKAEAATKLAELEAASHRERVTIQDVKRSSVSFPDTVTITETLRSPVQRQFMVAQVRKSEGDQKGTESKLIQDALNRKIVMAFPDATPLDDVLKSIVAATKSAELPGGLPIRLLPEARDLNLAKVRIKADDLTVREALKKILDQVGLEFSVADDQVRVTKSERKIEF